MNQKFAENIIVFLQRFDIYGVDFYLPSDNEKTIYDGQISEEKGF